MVKGIGVDIVEIDRIKVDIIKKEFIKRIFTEEEIKYCQSKANPEIHFAGRFAAKEAVSKAIGTGIRGLKWTDIEVLPDKLGMPLVYLGIAANNIAKGQGITEVMVSISHCDKYAVAYATAF